MNIKELLRKAWPLMTTSHHEREMLTLRRAKRQTELQLLAVGMRADAEFQGEVTRSIASLLEQGQTDEAARALRLYADFNQQTLADLERPTRTVREEAAYAEKYLQLMQLLMGSRLQYGVMVAANVDQEQLLPNMVLHTFCQNSVRHGISPKPEGGRVDVIITLHEDDIVVTVEDNGIGRRAAAKRSDHTPKLGLRVLNELMQFYNKMNGSRRMRQHASNLRSIEDNKISGTRFQLTVPVNFRFE